MSKNPRKNALLADQELFDGNCPHCQVRLRIVVQEAIGITTCPRCEQELVVPRSKIVRMYEVAQEKSPPKQ